MVLDTAVREKVIVKNLTPEDVQKGFTIRHVVAQQLERAININDEEETTKIAPIQSYLIYDGFEKDLDTAMVYKRLIEST